MLLALCAALTLAVLAMMPAPAYAHDTLISSDPADGDTLETSPEAITLTYSADILEVSPVVRIVDESGETIADVEPTVDGPDVTAAIEQPLAAGEYTVQWRVVSSDGHPIEGNLAITVEQDPAEPAAPSDGGGEGAASGASDAGASGGAGTSDAGTSDAGSGNGEESGDSSSESTEATEATGENGSSMPLLLGVVGVVVVGAAIAAFFALRKRS